MNFLKHRTLIYYISLALGLWALFNLLKFMFGTGPSQSAVIPLAEPGVAIFVLPILGLSLIYGLVFAVGIIVVAAELAEGVYKACCKKIREG